MKSSINVAVIGTGYWGKNHVRVYKGLESLGIVKFQKICDVDPVNGQKVADQYHLESTEDYKEILKDQDIDAVSLCTPNDTHYQLGLEFLRAGKHVLIEKPLTLTSKEAEKLAGFAEAENLILMAGHIFRFNPLVRRLKDELEKGALGDAYLLVANRTGLFIPRRECGVIMDLAIHDIDIALYLLDEQLPRKVRAIGGSFWGKKFEEAAFVALDFGEMTCYIFSSWLFPNRVRENWVMGSKGELHVDYANEKMLMFEKRITANANCSLQIHDGPCKELQVEKREPLELELTHFVEHAKKNQQTEVDGYVASKVIKVCEIAVKSLCKQQTMIVT